MDVIGQTANFREHAVKIVAAARGRIGQGPEPVFQSQVLRSRFGFERGGKVVGKFNGGHYRLGRPPGARLDKTSARHIEPTFTPGTAAKPIFYNRSLRFLQFPLERLVKQRPFQFVHGSEFSSQRAPDVPQRLSDL